MEEKKDIKGKGVKRESMKRKKRQEQRRKIRKINENVCEKRQKAETREEKRKVK